jgi:dihydrolipoamide dehydrogenase
MNKGSAQKEKQVVIIGAGTGGYSAAFMAAYLGLDVTLIDPEIDPGGVCLYRGCIPTKTLLYLVNLKKKALEAKHMGIQFEEPKLDINKIAEWKKGVVKKLTHGLGQLVKTHNIKYLRGYARFLDSHSIEFEGLGKEKRKFPFQHAIIATGVKPRGIPGIDIDGKDIIESSTALELGDLPEKLLVVGGGYIGLEMATIFRGLGSQVSIVELTAGFLPGLDRDLLNEFNKSNQALFTDVFLETSLKKVSKAHNGLRVTLENYEGTEFTKHYDRILIAAGEKPDHRRLALENTRVETDENGFVKVDQQQKTTDKNIFAIGDVTGAPLLAHKASYEGRIASEVIAGKKSLNDARVIPSVIYTEPEIATCGLSENEAKEKDIAHKTAKFRWSASGRAVAMNESQGFTKLLISPKDDQILGAAIIGKDAGNLIPEMALAIEMAANATDLAWTIHPHPTLSETIMEAAEIYLGHPTHTFNKIK